MIGTIRKHSKWLWLVIAALTIVSFVWFMAIVPVNGGGGPSGENPYGTIYGKPVSVPEYNAARNAFFIYYRLRAGQWPDQNSGMTQDDLEREVLVRILLGRKAAQLGIRVSDDTLAAAAADFLKSLGRDGQPVSLQAFTQQFLAPKGLGVVDLQNFLRGELVVQQLMQTLGLPGALVTPQEAGLIYDRENQEVSAQAIFFSASNYLAQAAITPAAVAAFYTNNLAAYRVPDRVQVNYVVFDVTNYLAQSKAEWAKTNLEENVDAYYDQHSAEYADAKTPAEAKTKIREQLIQYRALMDAHQAANGFASTLFAQEPVKLENFAKLAGERKLAIHLTAPFNANDGPTELDVPTTFAKAAFDLSADVPFGGPVVAQDGVYVISLAKQIPSAIPSLEQIRPQVTHDFQRFEAEQLARSAGVHFEASLTNQLTAGKTFAQAAVADGQAPVALTPFSLSTSDLPEIGGHADIRQVKQAAFTTHPGHASSFIPTPDGGFVLYVQGMLPVDEAKKTAMMPKFLAQVRAARQNEAFQLWLRGEAGQALRDTPAFKKESAGTNATASASQ